MIPTFILSIWLLGLLSVGIACGSVYLAKEWHDRSWGWNAAAQQSQFVPDFGWNGDTAILASATALVLLAFFGGHLIRLLLKLTRPKDQRSNQDPRTSIQPHSTHLVERPDGTALHVETYGPENGVPIVCTHGWGLNSREWNYLKSELKDHRLIVWDLPGLGKSSPPENRDFSLEKLANDLHSVLALANGKPAVLLGHSIGGMTVLTFCKIFPTALGNTVSGLILTHTTPTNPVLTTKGASFLSAIQKPVLVPLMYLTIWLSPVVWLMSWMSFRNGSIHLMNKFSSFGGTESWQQIDFAASFQPIAPPSILARGMLGMMGYDAVSVLSRIVVPTLVVIGNEDTTTKPEAGQQIAEQIPDVRLVTLQPAKHLGLIEHHRQYAEIVRNAVTEFTVKNASPG